MSDVLKLPKDGPVFVPAANVGEPGQLIIPLEGEGIRMPSTDEGAEISTALVLSVYDFQVNTVNKIVKSDKNILAGGRANYLKFFIKLGKITDVALVGYKRMEIRGQYIIKGGLIYGPHGAFGYPGIWSPRYPTRGASDEDLYGGR